MEYYLACGITLGLLLYTITLGLLLYTIQKSAIRQTEAQNNLAIIQENQALADLYDQAINHNGENPEKTGKRLIGEMRGRLQQSYGRTINFNELLAYLQELHNITPADFAAMSDDERQTIELAIYFAD